MKKIIVSFLMLVSFSFISHNTLAAELTGNIEVDYKKMTNEVKEQISLGNSEEINDLPVVEEFKKLYSEKETNEFLETTEAFEAFSKNNLKDIQVGKNEKKVIEFDDGSFIVLSDTTVPVISNSDVILAKSNDHSGSVGESWKTDYKEEWWGIYKTVEAHLVTRYTVYKDKITITDVDKTGTKTGVGFSLTNEKYEPVKNNAKSVQSKYSFTKVTGIAIDGFPIGWTESFTMRTDIKIKSVSGNTVKFTTNSYTE